MKVKVIYTTLILLIFTLLVKCSSIKNENLSRTYILKTKVGNEFIKLNNDGTFSFKCQIPLLESESNGNWLLKDNKVVLNSFEKYKNNYLEVNEYTLVDNTFIQVIDNENKGFYGAIIRVNNSQSSYITDENGLISLTNFELKQGDLIEINTVDLIPEIRLYKIKTIDKNKKIVIKIYPIKREIKYFENEVLLLKKNKLILSNNIYKGID